MAEVTHTTSDALEDTAESLQPLLEPWNSSARFDDDTDARAGRFHELVDKEFLGTLTSAETKELEVLTKWRDDQKSAFYENVAVG